VVLLEDLVRRVNPKLPVPIPPGLEVKGPPWYLLCTKDRRTVMLLEIAHAMAPQGQGGGGGGGFAALLPLILLFAIFYFILIRPQQKRAKEHRKLLENLKRGDKVLTAGGLYGTIVNIDGNVITLELADKVRVRVNRNYIAGLARE